MIRRPAALTALLRQRQQQGMVTPGNIDLHKRPIVHNPDGSISTVRSITVTDDNGRGIVLPTVSDDGRILSNPDAIALYRNTGRHLGVFRDEATANTYAQNLHNDQAAEYLPQAVAKVQKRAARPLLGPARRDF
jgi:hypothetical protein